MTTNCIIVCCYSNVAEALVARGLATVVRYRQDDDQRSSHYDELLAAEARAQKKLSGLHSNKVSYSIIHFIFIVTFSIVFSFLSQLYCRCLRWAMLPG